MMSDNTTELLQNTVRLFVSTRSPIVMPTLFTPISPRIGWKKPRP